MTGEMKQYGQDKKASLMKAMGTDLRRGYDDLVKTFGSNNASQSPQNGNTKLAGNQISIELDKYENKLIEQKIYRGND